MNVLTGEHCVFENCPSHIRTIKTNAINDSISEVTIDEFTIPSINFRQLSFFKVNTYKCIY